MLVTIGFGIATIVVIVAVGAIANRTRLPSSVMLTAVGLIYAALPGPVLRLDPSIVLDVVIPPLLYHAALGSSLQAIRSRLRTVVSLSVLLVVASAVAVGGALSALLPMVPLAAGVALGAAVAPPDPVSALSIGRRAGLPEKLSTLIEGEGLLNDATALTVYGVAVSVVVGGGFSFGLAVGEFALAAVGGIVIGAAVAAVITVTRRFLHDPLLVNATSLIAPYLAYVAADEARGSGVLAVVVAGLIIGYQNPRLQTGASRLQISAVWALVNFLLEGFVFLLIGQQAPRVVAHLFQNHPVWQIVVAAVVPLGVLLALRPLWLAVTQHVPRKLHARLGGEDANSRDAPLSAREITAMSWAGTRGVITLAAAFAIPRGFPARDLLLFSAYLIVLATLLGQGVTFGPLLRRLGLRADAGDAARVRNRARAAAVDAALDRLESLAGEDDVPEAIISAVRANLNTRAKRYRDRLSYLEGNGGPLRSPAYEAAVRARRAVIDAQHEELLRWRDAGRLPESSLRVLQRELDHEERTLASSTGTH
jgi:CPA1 family monovalent cation:H+ antiporter